MRANGMLRRFVRKCGSDIHQKRRQTLFVLLSALIRDGRLSVTGLGRAIVSPTSAKHAIKRAMRFVSNSLVHREVDHICSVLAGWLLRDVHRPVILVDWTPLRNGFYCLSAAVPVGGRALAIYEEVHFESAQNSARAHNRFLKRLQSVLPSGCIPIIVVDSGFRTPFFYRVRLLGWDFVGRLANNIKVRSRDEWIPATELYTSTTTKPRDLGCWNVAKTSKTSGYYRLVCVRKKRSRKRHATTPISAAQRKARKRNLNPWLLVTSLHDLTAIQIVALYKTRMQIEEMFRDKKNHRFGWSLNHARSHHAQHWRVLLMIAAVSMFALTLIGIDAERRHLHRRFQANTVSNRRVLSHLFLAMQMIRAQCSLRSVDWDLALSDCQQYIQRLTEAQL